MLHGSVSPKGACTICLWNGCNFVVNVLYFVCFICSGISLIHEEEEHWTANSKSIKIAENTTSQAKRRQFTEGTCTYLAIHRFRWSKRYIQYTNYIAYINSSRVSPVGTPKIILGITGLSETLGRDDGIEEPYYGTLSSSSGRPREGARGVPPTLFLVQTEAEGPKKNKFKTPPPPPPSRIRHCSV